MVSPEGKRQGVGKRTNKKAKLTKTIREKNAQLLSAGKYAPFPTHLISKSSNSAWTIS